VEMRKWVIAVKLTRLWEERCGKRLFVTVKTL